MPGFSLILVLQFKTSKIIHDMAKVQQKSEKITAFGGIFFVLDKFDSILSSVIDSHLGLRSTLIGYQYSEIAGSLASVYFCGGDCVEDITSHLMPHLSLHPTLRTCSSETILRAISERIFSNLESEDIHIRRARMDCGSCSREIVETVEKHSEHFYIRANR